MATKGKKCGVFKMVMVKGFARKQCKKFKK
jgi:hypothetical protein